MNPRFLGFITRNKFFAHKEDYFDLFISSSFFLFSLFLYFSLFLNSLIPKCKVIYKFLRLLFIDFINFSNCTW